MYEILSNYSPLNLLSPIKMFIFFVYGTSVKIADLACIL